MTPAARLTYASALVLHAVANGYRHGFDIMDASGLPSGTVYPALRRLERSGYVKSKWEADTVAQQAKRPRRRYYEVSRLGRDALSLALQRFRLLTRPLGEQSTGAEPKEA